MYLETWMIFIIFIVSGLYYVWVFNQGYKKCYSLIEAHCTAALTERASLLIQEGYTVGFKACQELYRLEAVRQLTARGEEIPEALKNEIV